MQEVKGNIFTIFDEVLQRQDKEALLNQRGMTLWLTGLSGSGKTTIAKALELRLHKSGYLCELLDGDNIRAGICNNLGFSEEDRAENIRRIAETSKLFVHCGIITINCFVSPTTAVRTLASEIIGPADFHEIFIDTPLEICESRDVKGLYKKARAGEIKNFTGISAPFEAPTNPSLRVETAQKSIEESADMLFEYIRTKTTR